MLVAGEGVATHLLGVGAFSQVVQSELFPVGQHRMFKHACFNAFKLGVVTWLWGLMLCIGRKDKGSKKREGEDDQVWKKGLKRSTVRQRQTNHTPFDSTETRTSKSLKHLLSTDSLSCIASGCQAVLWLSPILCCLPTELNITVFKLAGLRGVRCPVPMVGRKEPRAPQIHQHPTTCFQQVQVCFSKGTLSMHDNI